MGFEEVRQKIVNRIPSWYNPYLHAFIPSFIGLAIIVFSIFLIKEISIVSLVSIPITLFLLFGFEWIAHKHILHTRRPLLGQIYELHELSHHIIYTDKQMAIQEKKELYYIMMPPYAIVLVFCLISPLIFGMAAIFSLNVACLILITAMFFFLSYEWLHFSYHQPANSWIGRNRIIKALRRLHRRHHNPKLMKHWNFNVTIPVFDWILGTYWKDKGNA